LAGDPGTVLFLVSATVEQLPPDQLPAFIAGPLARTVRRLEGELGHVEGVTRERIVDIVVRALGPLRGAAQVGRLVPPLLGYLAGQPGSATSGVYMTAAQLAQLMVGLDDTRNRLIRTFLYH
jgi:hypothetical protein